MALPVIPLQSVLLVMALDREWHIRIGDPSATGWFTVAAYLVVACLAYAASSACRDSAFRLKSFDPLEAENHRLLARLWMIAATVMLLLGINRQFALLSLVLDTLRHLALENGWYEERYRYQWLFILVMVFLGALVISLMLYWLRPVIRRVLGGVFALNFMVLFVIIRASSFHPIDLIWYSRAPYMNQVFELGGIFMVGFTAELARRSGRSTRMP